MAIAVSCSKDSGPVPTPGMVDLGLSVKWASFNLGASRPEDSGDYYQWAGTEDVSDTGIDVSWSTCPYHTGEDYNKGWTKYVSSKQPSYWSGPGSPDNKTVLDSEDDVAHVKLGGKWRMPTTAEWTELMFDCLWTWTERNGVKGYIVSGKKSGYTDNYIFLPAAGFRSHGNLDDSGIKGYYWSASIMEGETVMAWGLGFRKGNFSRYFGTRSIGFSVRPVAK